MKEDKTEFTNKMNDEIKKSFQVPQYWSKIPNKSITFDYEAQQNLPQWVKDKMKKDRLNCDLSTKANNETP